MTDIDYRQDGHTHICLSPTANTELGRTLYIGAHRPFVDPQYGYFASVIAFWVWFDSGRHDSLREIHHNDMIRSSLSGLRDEPGNRQAVTEVLRRSIFQDAALCQSLRQSELPFAAYEVLEYDGRESPAVYPLSDRQWYVRELEAIREELKTSG